MKCTLQAKKVILFILNNESNNEFSRYIKIRCIIGLNFIYLTYRINQSSTFVLNYIPITIIVRNPQREKYRITTEEKRRNNMMILGEISVPAYPKTKD